MVIKYFGPQSETTRTIDQSLRALPFSTEIELARRPPSTSTMSSWKCMLDPTGHSPPYKKSRWPLSSKSASSTTPLCTRTSWRRGRRRISRIASRKRRLPASSASRHAFRQYYELLEVHARSNGTALVSRYGSFHAENVHSYSGTATDHDLEDHIGTDSDTDQCSKHHNHT